MNREYPRDDFIESDFEIHPYTLAPGKKQWYISHRFDYKRESVYIWKDHTIHNTCGEANFFDSKYEAMVCLRDTFNKVDPMIFLHDKDLEIEI